MFLVPFYGDVNTAKWELKKEHNPFISKHNTQELHDLYFPKGVLNMNEHSKCEGQKQF